MMNGKKKLRKRITAFLMTLVMVMTLVMSVEPMRVRAAGTPGSPVTISSSEYTLTRPSSNGYYIAAYVKTSSTKEIRFINGSSGVHFDYVYIDGNLRFSHGSSSSITIYKASTETNIFSSGCYIKLQLEAGKVYYVEWYRNSSGKDYLYISALSEFTITYHPYNASQFSDTYYKYTKDGTYTYRNSSNYDYSLRSITSKTGYTSGWYTEQNGGSNITALSQISSNIHLYERNIPYTYSVKFNINTPSGASSSSTQMANQQFTYDDFTKYLSRNTYEVPGYDFLGWSTSQAATTPTFTDGALMNRNLTSKNNATVNLYAVWEKQGMKITYDSNAAGTTGSMGMQKIILNTPMALTTNQFVNPGNQGMAFKSWNTASDGSGTTYTNRQNVNFSTPGAMTLYAQWDEAGVKITKTADSSVNYYHNIKEALDENSGTAMTITLLKDDTSNPGTIPANVTVDLADLTWTPGGNVTNNGVIKGGTFDGAVSSDTGKAVLTNKGTIENIALNNVKVKQGSALTDASMGTVKGGTVGESSSVILGTVAGTVTNNGTIIGPKVADGATISGTAPQFIVQFDKNGHDYENQDADTEYKYQLITSGGKVTKPEIPVSTGVLFNKWGKTGAGDATQWNYDTDTVTENTIIYAIWEDHTHTWEYGVDTDTDSATIYAWCTGNPLCPYHAESVGEAENLAEKVSITMTAADTIYDGAAYEDSNVTYKDATGNAVADGKFPVTANAIGTITYYLSDGVTKTGTVGDTASGATAEGGAPVNAGTYYASVTVNGATAKESFTISPKSLKASTVTVTLSGTGITGNVTNGYAFVWDGNRKSPVITVTDNETGSTLGYETDYTVSGTEDARNIGTYYITLTGTGNYNNKVKITWKITKASISPSVSLAGWVYGDTPNEPQITGAEITGDVTYTYYKDEACTVKTTAADGATENGGVPAYAGNYYVKADVAETQNYEAASAKTSFTISKKDVTVTPKSGQKKTYGEYDPELTYNAVLVGDDTLTGSLARTEGENVGSYSITQGTLANSNYNIIFTTGVTFSIEQKQLTDDMLSLDPVNYTYTGATVSPTVCYHDDTTKVDGTNVTEADIDKYGAKRASDYGVYTIELEGKGNYKGTIYKQWCISPVQDVTVTYDGDPHKIAYTTGAGFDLKFKDADGNYTLTDVSEQTMPGVYRYDYRMVIDEETIDGYAVLTINKIPFVGTLNMAERIGYGETLNPSVTGCSSDGDITYYYKKQGQPNSAYTETKPVNVGNYTVKAVVDATATQAGGTLTKDFEITKGTLTPVNPDKAVYACGDNGTKSVTLHDSYNELDGVSYTLGDVTDSYDILADSSVSVSRTGEVSYTLTGSSTVDAEAVIKVIIKSTNYEDITVDVTIGVDASVPVITGVTDGKTYCTAQTITVEDDSLDKVEINGTEVTLTSENTYTLAATGTTYIIKATDRAGNSSTVTVTVNNGHTWQNNPVFTWNGYTSATAKFTCSIDASHTEDKNCTISHVTTPAKCLVDGKRVYTASITVDGTTYTNTNPTDEVITATGHTWNYDAEGDTLYAWCSGDCDYHGESKADAKSTLKIAATDATYDTEAYEQEKVSLKDKNNAAVTGGTFPVTGDVLGTITYYLSDGITKTGTAADTTSGAAAEGAAPVNAGSYYAAITVSGKTAKASFTISRAEQSAGVSMDSYDFGGNISTPTITGAQENPAVTYYYNTENSNQGGTEWKNMTAETLDKGTYYMYAVLAATDNYNAYTTPAVSFTVNAKNMTGIVAEPVVADYDKAAHGITVSGYPTDATVTYGETEGSYTMDSSPAYTNVRTEAYTVYFKITAKGHNDYTGSTTVTIKPREAVLSWSDTAFTYDGSVHTPTATVSNLCAGDTCTVTVTGGQKDYSASAYTATATALDNPNYKLPDAETAKQTEFTIGKKELGVTWSNTEFTYDQTAHKPTATLTGVVTGDTCNVTVTGEQTNAGTGYVATASIDNANYKIKTADETTTFTIIPKTITADMISLDHADKKYTVTGGTITPSVTVKDQTATLEPGETKDYVLSGETSHAQYGTHTITVTGKGNYTGSSTVAWTITDPNAPSGAIAIVSKTWDSFPAGTDFGYFFKETQQVTIRATDGREESGVDKVYYCKSLTPLTTTEQISGAAWTEIENGGSFTINPNANVYVYAKLTDRAGNVTYLASDGMVIYTDSAQATESITFTKTSTADVTADVVLNGNTISNITLGDTTLVKNQDYTISENGATIAFKASFLQTLAARDAAYTLTVSYNPGGKTFVEAAGNDRPLDTTIALTVEKAQGSLTDISDISKVYDGLTVAEPTFTTTNDKGTDNANVTFVYKKKGAADSTYTVEKPVNAGIYVVKVTVAADDDYEAVSNTAEFTIAKAEIAATAVDYEGTYDGAAHGITVNVTEADADYAIAYGKMPEDADAQITYGQNSVTFKDAGTYTVYYKVSSPNYNDTFGSAKVKIVPKAIGITWSDVSFVYDGEDHMPVAVATGLEGDDVCSITVTGAKMHAGTDYVATATAVSNSNYKLPANVTTTFAIQPADITVTAMDAAKHIGKNDPEFTYKLTAGALVEGDSLTGIFCSRTAGEAAGEYALTVAEQSGSNPDYHITFVPGTLTIEDHVAAVDAAVAPTCTETGLAEGTHCSVCEKVLVAQEVVDALGHDWSGDWKVTREATATEDGRREITCKRDGCDHTKYESIPAIGTEEISDPNAGELEKFADVAADSPIPEAALGNKKAELLEAPGIFTAEEKEAIKAGADAKVWLEITKTDEGSIPADAKAKMTDAAKQIMGDNLEVVYFDAGLYKQINGGSVTELHEPGIGIRVTVRLPEQLLNHDKSISREYKILRLHNGDVTVLGAVFHEATGELTFETDKFSTYAIVYSDKKLVTEVKEPSKEDTVTTTTTDSPATGDAAEPLYWMMIMLLSLGAIVIVSRKKEDKQ